MAEVCGDSKALPFANSRDSSANLGAVTTSHISGGAGWWKSPSPDLGRASAGKPAGATRQEVYERDVVFKNVLIVTVCAENRADLERLIGWNVTPLRSIRPQDAFRRALFS